LFILFLLAVLGFELRAFHFLGKCSNTGVIPQSFSLYLFFRCGLTLLPRVGLRPWSSSLWLPCSWNYSYEPLYLFYYYYFLTRLSLNNNPPISTSPVSGIIDMTHGAW
jgi:hypothetical protein